jgi:hypothetical protein
MRKLMLLASLALVAALAVPATAATPKAALETTAGCPTPLLVQKLAAKATKVETVTDTVNGKPAKVVRFYLPTATSPSNVPGGVEIVGYVDAKSPNHFEGGFYWYYDATTWVSWYMSDPCTGPDGFAFGFNERAGRSVNSSGSPRTAVAANFDLYAALEYDHTIHDWDPVWGHKHYNPQNQASCADDGGYHFFSDAAPGELRTWIRTKVRFLSIDYLTPTARKTTSMHVDITSVAGGPSEHGGLGVGTWLESKTPPSGNITEVPRPGC